MTGKEQRVKALAERLQPPEAVAQGMVAEDPEKARQVAQAILRLTGGEQP